MDYNSFILSNAKKNTSLERHHIIPRSVCDSPYNNVTVYLTPAEHCFAHFLYDRENGTDTGRFYRNVLGLSKDDVATVTLEDCRKMDEFSVRKSKSISDTQKECWSDKEKRAKRVKNMSLAKQGKVNVCKDRVWVNNGKVNKRIGKYELEDYVKMGFRVGQYRTVNDK